ncbi:hypothetical protein DFH29DRAFT_982561 [Suillus ampliporus]|nr:hypothetical protein DFH29DRAFT_982561 [Suillus ampliporus]
MEYFLRAFAKALQTAQFVGKGPYMSRKDRGNLPMSKSSREQSNSQIEDEDLKDELLVHLQSLGKYVMASAIVKYLAKPDIRHRYNLSKICWMKTCGFRWTTAKNGQYIDGHEREDVVNYRQNIFLPAWYTLESKMRKWLPGQLTSERRTVVWFHDESTFYTHDRHEKSTPQPKGQGVSLMAVDFVSADYGWLRSHDGTQSARILFHAGKARDGYFTNDEIIRHAEKAMMILEKDYPDDDHVFIFDNTLTHLKRADDAISARQMPKGCRCWGVDTPVWDTQGKPICGPDGKPTKQKVRMANGFHDGAPQEFYWPEGHEKSGLFKGMAVILTEHGFDVEKLKAQCRNFECAAGAMDCCCRRILYCQPDFKNVKSLLETTCKARGFQDSDLEINVVKALDSVPIASMQRFAIRSRRFMDAYHKGLNGSQAAWAAKKYCGHRVLPGSIFTELDAAHII